MKLSVREQMYVALFAGITAVLSQFTIPLALIPLTLQTFAVGLAVTILGMKVGTWSIALYLLMGLIGLPVFAGGAAGFSVLLGPTGGYLVGFLFTGLVTGYILEKTEFNYFMAFVANTAGALVTLFFGTVWLQLSAGMTFTAAMASGFIPFLIPGVIKAAGSAYVGILIRQRLIKANRYYSVNG